jgi:hypothetical protein
VRGPLLCLPFFFCTLSPFLFFLLWIIFSFVAPYRDNCTELARSTWSYNRPSSKETRNRVWFGPWGCALDGRRGRQPLCWYHSGQRREQSLAIWSLLCLLLLVCLRVKLGIYPSIPSYVEPNFPPREDHTKSSIHC